MADSTSHILQALAANAAIAIGKGIAAFVTGSGAMLAETLHSSTDCGNQLLLLLGVKRARKAPDALHPLGYGPALYFWSFLVAMLLFSAGGLFSIYEGVHKLAAPEPVHDVGLALAILGGSLLIEGWATWSNIAELNRRRRGVPFLRFLRATKDSDLVVIFGENAAAVLGLALAMVALGLAWLTGDARWDAFGSLAVGIVLVLVALFLAVEIKSLLLGEAADGEVVEALQAAAAGDTAIVAVHEAIAVQRGPGEVLVALKLALRPDLDTADVYAAIVAFEARVRAARPEVRWLFVEPAQADGS
jgi:cation diffusion facilitator family transporter